VPTIAEPDSTLVAAVHPSPNIEPRQSGMRPDIILLHYTGMSSAERAIDWLSRPESRVSAHYVVDEAGRITQLVAEAMRAWHAGVSVWQGACDINSLSIGIEIQNPGHEDGYAEFPPEQMWAVAALCRDISRRHGVRPERVLAHSDVAPARKIDPGEKFDWGWLAARGVGHWVAPAVVDSDDAGLGPGAEGAEVAELQGLLRDYGYGCADHGALDAATATVVKAFQRHFRPARVDGRIDRSTRTTLERLIDTLPRPLTV
jgi:N-acetylmuramoyl-L-alanine amidase